MTDSPPDRAPSDRPPSEALWDGLRRLTAARIGLARTGASLTTGPLLDFRLAHSRARDAVHEPLDQARLAAELGGLSDPVLMVASAAGARSDYLMRPDLGRRLAADAAANWRRMLAAMTSCSRSRTGSRRARCRRMRGRFSRA